MFSANGETLIFYPAGLQQQSYRVPAKVKKIDAGAFRGAKLKTVDTGNAALIGMHAFADCGSLQSAVLGEGLTALGFGAFQNCSALTQVQLPHSLAAVDSMVFSGCTSLSKLTLPIEITDIAPDAFEKTTTLCVAQDAPILDKLKNGDWKIEIIQKKS